MYVYKCVFNKIFSIICISISLLGKIKCEFETIDFYYLPNKQNAQFRKNKGIWIKHTKEKDLNKPLSITKHKTPKS